MAKVTLVYRSDVHLADEAPSSRTDDWPTTVLGKLTQVGEIARELKADGVLDNGDHFHIKTPSRNSHALLRRDAAVHAGYPCDTWANMGNHDVKYGSMDFLEESPLSVLYDSGVFKRLYDQHEAVFQRDGVKVRVVGIPYHGTKYEMDRFKNIVKGDEDWLVCMAHMLASKVGGTMFEAEDIVRYSDLTDFAPDVFMFGHWHKNQGITEIAKNKWVVNIGSLTRGALTQDEMDRQPSVAVMDFDKSGISIREMPLKIAPPKEVFDVIGRARLQSRNMSVDALVDNLKMAMSRRPEGSLLDEIRVMGDISDEVRERTISYLEQTGYRK